MAGQDLLSRTERALPQLRALANRVVALEKQTRESARLEAVLAAMAERLAALEAKLAEPAGPAALEKRLQEHARVIQLLQDRIARMERLNRELAIRLDQALAAKAESTAEPARRRIS